MGCACIRQDVVVKNQKLFIDRNVNERENNQNNDNIQNNQNNNIEEINIINRPTQINAIPRNLEFINQPINNNEPFLQSRMNSNFNFQEIGKFKLTQTIFL